MLKKTAIEKNDKSLRCGRKKDLKRYLATKRKDQTHLSGKIELKLVEETDSKRINQRYKNKYQQKEKNVKKATS